MSYINQNRGDVRCGAYTTAYWIWEKGVARPNPSNVDDEEEVHKIYSAVRFDDKDMLIIKNNKTFSYMAEAMRGFSNPFKISNYLNKKLDKILKKPTTVQSANAALNNMLQVVGRPSSVTKVNSLINGESAILIMGTTDVGGRPNPQHYIYAFGNDNIKLSNGHIGMTIIDPAYGERLDVGFDLEGLPATFHGMKFLDAVIR